MGIKRIVMDSNKGKMCIKQDTVCLLGHILSKVTGNIYLPKCAKNYIHVFKTQKPSAL